MSEHKVEDFLQSRWQSWTETALNVISGMFIAWSISQLAAHNQEYIQLIWSDFHWDVGAASNIAMTIVLTAISLLRSFLWRRTFNHVQKFKIQCLLDEEKQSGQDERKHAAKTKKAKTRRASSSV